MSASNNAENVVLGIVREYLSKKPFFSIKDIVEFVNNRVRHNPDINKNRIELIIKSLIKNRVIIPGTKLMKKDIIDNPTRNEIYKYIKQNPGRNINEIMKTHNLGSNLALWHLSALEKFQFVRSKKIRNRCVFFKFDSDPKFDQLHYYLANDIVQSIIKLMKNERPLKITEIVDSLKKNHNTIKKYLDALTTLKLVEIEKEKSRNLYKLNKERYLKAEKLVSRG
jgi:predicted transcriptional regulator